MYIFLGVIGAIAFFGFLAYEQITGRRYSSIDEFRMMMVTALVILTVIAALVTVMCLVAALWMVAVVFLVIAFLLGLSSYLIYYNVRTGKR